MTVIRNARAEDAERRLEIYGYYVENTAITFEYAVPSPEEFKARMERTVRRYPYLVIEEDGKVLPVLFRAFYLNEISGHKRFYGSLTDLAIIGDMLKHYGMSGNDKGTGAE